MAKSMKHRITCSEETFKLLQSERGKRGMAVDALIQLLIRNLNERDNAKAPKPVLVCAQTQTVPLVPATETAITQTPKNVFRDFWSQTENQILFHPIRTYGRKPKSKPVSHITYGLALESDPDPTPDATPEKVQGLGNTFFSKPVASKSLSRKKHFRIPLQSFSPIMGDKNILSDDECEDLVELRSDDEDLSKIDEMMASEEEDEVAGGFENIDENDADENMLNFTHTFTEASDVSTELDIEEIQPEVEKLGSDLESLIIEPTIIASTETTKHNVKDEMAIVRVPTLLVLVKKAYGSKCKGCAELLEFKTKYIGTAIQVNFKCMGPGSDAKRHSKGRWSSQPLFHGLYAGNITIASCIPLSGNLYGKIALFMRHSKILFFKKDTYNDYQTHFIAPAVSECWENTQRKTFEELRGQVLVVAGDGRNDSPGHCSMECAYTTGDMKSQKIISVKVRDVRHAGGKSTNMEILAFELAVTETFELAEQFDCHLSEIVTDAHVQITSLMKKHQGILKNIKHSWDIWHVSKNLLKKMMQLSQQKGLEVIAHWAPLIRTHFWWCARECKGDKQVMKGLWFSLLQHVCNRHEWTCPMIVGGPLACAHEELTEDQIEEHEWIAPNSKAFDALHKFVKRPYFINNMDYYVNFRHTGFLENYHSLVLMYAPKRFAFGWWPIKRRFHRAPEGSSSEKGSCRPS